MSKRTHITAPVACVTLLIWTCASSHVVVLDDKMGQAISRIADVPAAELPAQTTALNDELPTLYDQRQKIVTLGDSYSSGTGIWTSGKSYDEIYGGSYMGYKFTVRADNECWREEDDTPGPLYAALQPQERTSIFMACKGAEIAHVWNQFQLIQRQWVDDAAAQWKGAIFVLTAGSNDIRTAGGRDWTSLLDICMSTVRKCSKVSTNTIRNFDSIEQRLSALFEVFAMQAGQAKFRVMGYPRVMLPSRFSCSAVTGISRSEAEWMDQQADLLNTAVQGAVSRVNAEYPKFDIKYVSVVERLVNGACHIPPAERDVNDRIFNGIYRSDSSFHPTKRGYRGYYDAFVNSL